MINLSGLLKNPTFIGAVVSIVSVVFGTTNPTGTLPTNAQDGLMAISTIILGFIFHNHVKAQTIVSTSKKLGTTSKT